MTTDSPYLDYGRIALVGHAGVGKTLVAREFWKRWGYERLSYAHPLKHMVAALMRTSYTEVNRRDFKLQVLNSELGTTNRNLLEAVGEAVRSVGGADYFVKTLHRELTKPFRELVIVDDLRKAIEWTHWADIGGVLVALKPSWPMPKPTDAHVESVESLMAEADYTVEVDMQGRFVLPVELQEGINEAVRLAVLKRLEASK